MNKKEFIKNVCDLLRQQDVRKPVSIPKQVFHICDNDGNSKDFTIKKTDKTVIYTKDDVTAILEAGISVIQEALKRGESVSFHGLGSLGLRYRKPRMTKKIGTDTDITIAGRFVPKFSFGNDLRMCAKIYELSLSDKFPKPEPVYDATDGVIENEDGDLDGN